MRAVLRGGLGVFFAVLGLTATSVAAAQQAAAPAAPVMTREALIEAADRIEKDVARLRGWPFKHPVKKDVYTEDQLREFILKALDKELGGGRLERKQAMLSMVGLLPPNEDMRKTIMDVLLNQVGGFYDPETKSFYMLIREGIPYVPMMNDILIAHELCHALDDQYVDLGKLTDTSDHTEDATLAIGAIVEGSATVLMQRYTISVLQDSDMPDMTDLVEAEMKRAEAFFTAPRYYSALLANYLCGMNFYTRGDMTFILEPDAGRRMQRMVLQAAANPPRSTEQILHPEKYWDEAHRDEPVLVDDEPIIRLLETGREKVIHRDTLGELLMALLTQEQNSRLDIMQAMFSSYWTNDAARGWGGDRFFLVADADTPAESGVRIKSPRGLWITAWDTADDREEFADDYEYYRESIRKAVIPIGQRVAVFTFGFEPAEIERLREALPGALRFRKDGAAWSADDRE